MPAASHQLHQFAQEPGQQPILTNGHTAPNQKRNLRIPSSKITCSFGTKPRRQWEIEFIRNPDEGRRKNKSPNAIDSRAPRRDQGICRTYLFAFALIVPAPLYRNCMQHYGSSFIKMNRAPCTSTLHRQTHKISYLIIAQPRHGAETYVIMTRRTP